MNRERWVWQGHAGHFIAAHLCRFKLNTYLGNGYLVSTVGEYVPERSTRECIASSREVEIEGKGDLWDLNYHKQFGFEEIGYGRKYETMVFKAKESTEECCLWEVADYGNIDFEPYNTAKDARLGHTIMCEKWSLQCSTVE